MNNTTNSLEEPILADESLEATIAEPAEQIGAVEATESVELSDSAEIVEITESIEPTESTELSELVEAVETTEPTELIDSVDTTQLSESVEPSLATSVTEDATAEVEVDKENTIIDQVGQLTRTLHESLCELGFDKRLRDISAEAPEAQDRLTYIAKKAEEAAEKVLNATDTAMPIQDNLSSESINLSEQWKKALEAKESSPDDAEKYKNLIISTLSFLDNVPKQTSATNTQLMEIMMAQDFQDLTGQVVAKVNKMVKDLEFELLQLLVANVPEEKRNNIDEGLMNGPVVNSEKRNDVVSNQEQVDDLLASMGF